MLFRSGKVRVAHMKRVPMPDGNLVDADGKPTNDPARFFENPVGALLPFGEHKGYGMAMACELLAGAVSGAKTLHQPQIRSQIINNMLSIVIDPRIYGTQDTCAKQAAAFVDWVKASPVRDGMEMMIAGDPERKVRAQRGADGIPVDANTWQQIRDAGASVGVKMPA